jgi:6-phosphogluconolactonase (cycloisomerase 2 family)
LAFIGQFFRRHRHNQGEHMKMQRPLRTLAAASLMLGIGVIATSSFAGATSAKDLAPTGHALFVETDASSGNSVLSYTRGTDGTVSYVATYATGGTGATAAGAAADPLASQGGLALADNGSELLAVNAGSDTVSVFAVFGPYLHLIQQVPSNGNFPVSISVHNNLVAVLNSGGAGSVSEYQLQWGRLVPTGQTRSLGLSNTTPPNFLAGAGQLGYSPNGQFLVVTTKNSTSSYEVFTVGFNGNLSSSPTVTPATNAVPFSFNFDAHGRLVAGEASNSSVSTYSINANGSLAPIGTVSDGAKALCWIASAQGYFFGSNAGSGTVSSFGEGATGVPSLLNATAATTHPGTTDSATSPDGQFLYVESGGAGALDAFAVNANGSLTPLETLWNLPTPYEGIAVS